MTLLGAPNVSWNIEMVELNFCCWSQLVNVNASFKGYLLWNNPPHHHIRTRKEREILYVFLLLAFGHHVCFCFWESVHADRALLCFVINFRNQMMRRWKSWITRKIFACLKVFSSRKNHNWQFWYIYTFCLNLFVHHFTIFLARLYSGAFSLSFYIFCISKSLCAYLMGDRCSLKYIWKG
jgi:hypothetical protein